MLAVIFASAAPGVTNRLKDADVGTGSSLWPDGIHAQDGTLPGGFLPVQSRNPSGLAAGKLLVASRGLADPHFRKAAAEFFAAAPA